MSQQILNDVDVSLQSQLEELRERGYEATGMLSNPDARAAHPTHQAVVALGPAVVPLLLRDVERRHNHWFMALTAITKENPIRPEHAGFIPKMVEDWSAWGEQGS